MSLAATICNDKVAEGISSAAPGLFMHGPTFMGNPLACACANASIELLLSSDWAQNVSRIQNRLTKQLKPMSNLEAVKDSRVLGAIGVLELHNPVDMYQIAAQFVKQGVWVRPFGTLVYVMPPFSISNSELDTLMNAIHTVIDGLH